MEQRYQTVREVLEGAYDYGAVALVLRRASEPPPVTARPVLRLLHDPDVPVPTCIQYDQLLSKGKRS